MSARSPESVSEAESVSRAEETEGWWWWRCRFKGPGGRGLDAMTGTFVQDKFILSLSYANPLKEQPAGMVAEQHIGRPEGVRRWVVCREGRKDQDGNRPGERGGLGWIGSVIDWAREFAQRPVGIEEKGDGKSDFHTCTVPEASAGDYPDGV